jgi:hypothetical protein
MVILILQFKKGQESLSTDTKSAYALQSMNIHRSVLTTSYTGEIY